MKGIYNPKKLTTDRERFHKIRVLNIGAGAVGSAAVEHEAKLCLSLDVIDDDRFEPDNAAKRSCLVRTPEDDGSNKALCLGHRVQPLLDDGCTANGIDANLRLLGPEALADYDVIVCAVDNNAAKVLLNELVRRLPEERRPVVIMDGTHGEMAQSVMLDNRDFCLRCLMDESWMKDASVRTSCTGPRVHRPGDHAEHTTTSDLASSVAAHLSCEQLRAYVSGEGAAMNKRLTYTVYPQLALDESRPLRDPGCPGCRIGPPKNLRWLRGTVLEVTLGEALEQLREALGTDDFELMAHRLSLPGAMFTGFITDGVCHCCGEPIRVMRHEGRTSLSDLRCPDCTAKGLPAQIGERFTGEKMVYGFSPASEAELKALTLFELGYPLGAHIDVLQRGDALDITDACVTKTVFAFDGDHEQMHRVTRL